MEMIDPIVLTRVPLLLGIANSAPIFTKYILGDRRGMPARCRRMRPAEQPAWKDT
jgi:hypothetical protein